MYANATTKHMATIPAIIIPTTMDVIIQYILQLTYNLSSFIKTQQLSKKRYVQVFFQKTLVYLSSFFSLYRNNRSYTITLDGSDAESMVSTLRKFIRCPRFSDMPLHDILYTLLQRILVWQSNTEWHTRGFRTVPPVSPFTNGYIASLRQERVVVKTLCRLMISQWDIFRTFIVKKFRTVNMQKPQYVWDIAVTTFLSKIVRPCFHIAVFAHELPNSSRLFTSCIITRYSNMVKLLTVHNSRMI